MKKVWLATVLMLAAIQAAVAQVDQADQSNIQPYVETVQKTKEGMTLLEILETGGTVMALHGIISLFMIALVLYLLIRLNAKKLMPAQHSERVISLIKQRSYLEARAQCQANENLTSTIALAGLSSVDEHSLSPDDAVELAARKEISGFWNSLSYLSDIAQIAPMLGLLGTVLGMIQAFNTIAFDAGVVKPMLLAGGVSKAMITTAGGLVIAIIAMFFYSILRVRVLNLSGYVEAMTSQLMEAFKK